MSRLPLIGLVVVLALTLVGCTDSAETTAPRDEALPEVTLASFAEAEPLDLGELEGPAVLNFWASWCGPCRRELPVVEAFAEKHPGVQVVGIDFQDQQTEAAAELLARTGADYPMYVDPLGELSGQAPFPNLRGLPYTAFVDSQGRLTHGEFIELESVDQLEEMVREHLSGQGLS